MFAKLLSEWIGTLLLLTTVVGSGIMGEQLSSGNTGLSLLINALATGASLFVLISILGPISGAHFNPLVSLMERAEKRLSNVELGAYWGAQVSGAMAGVVLAHVMFQKPMLFMSTHVRSGMAQYVSEVVATCALFLVILGFSKFRPQWTPVAVAAQIVAAYFYTSSTSFANPAVTMARAFTDTFAGIQLQDVPMFIVSQCVGALLAWAVFKMFDSSRESNRK